ncbi:MAG TPA: glutamate 5-kinase [Polyangiaceae bacterium]|nr:glutamate 5-kinase [Polyangiaceae bacterium]
MESGRKALGRARRIIVKIGSNALADHPELIENIATEVAELTRHGASFVIVSSGAVALGWRRLGYRRRPRETAQLQAAAAAGQGVLMNRYAEAFGAHGLGVAQVLLTHSDLSKRGSLNNARAAFGALLDARAVPIVNENDTVSTDEIRFGDNDQLAAMVTPLIGADLLVLLSNVEGVLDEHGERISLFDAHEVFQHRAAEGAQGTGGIVSKVEAARKACRSGARAVIAYAHAPRVLHQIVGGEDTGTLFEPRGNALRARKHWIAYTLRPRGTLVVDQGAVAALQSGKKSLLPIGVLGVRGQFDPGDAVRLVGPGGEEVARGLSRMSSAEAARVSGASRDTAPSADNGKDPLEVIVHKDDLVLMD